MTQIKSGDTLKTPSGDVTIEDIDDRRGTVTLSDGRKMAGRHIKHGLAEGPLDLIPAGTGDRDVYIRFGDIPDGERSYDNRNSRKEAGVSVYACEQDTPDEIDANTAYYLKANMLQTAFGLIHRGAYLVSGERVGTGADGEPVIRDVKIESELTTPKGCGGFVEV